MIDYDNLLEDIKDISKRYTIIQGIFDIKKRDIIINGNHISTEFYISNIKNSYWVLIGNDNEEMIVDCLEDFIPKVEREGEYFIECVLSNVGPEYTDGAISMQGYLDIDYIKYQFQQSFEEREREMKLTELLGEFENLFKC